MKKTLVLLLTICLTLGLTVPCFAEVDFDIHKKLDNYKSYAECHGDVRSRSDQENHEIYMFYKDKTVEEVIAATDPDEFICFVIFLETKEISQKFMDAHTEGIRISPDDPIYETMYGKNLNCLLKYGSDVIIHSLDRFVGCATVCVKQSIAEEFLQDEMIASYSLSNHLVELTNAIDDGSVEFDLNEDKRFNQKDVSVLLRHLAGWDTGYGVNRYNADANDDYLVDFKDVTLLLKYLSES